MVDAPQPIEGLRFDHPVGAAVEGGAGQIDHERAATGHLQALLAQGERLSRCRRFPKDFQHRIGVADQGAQGFAQHPPAADAEQGFGCRIEQFEHLR